jgi:hypothetical protein
MIGRKTLNPREPSRREFRAAWHCTAFASSAATGEERFTQRSTNQSDQRDIIACGDSAGRQAKKKIKGPTLSE